MQKKAQNIIGKLIEWLIYLSVFLIPLIFIPQVASVFTTPKLYAFRAITLIIILFWTVGLLIGRKVKFRWAPFFWFVIAYGLISIINTFISVNIWSSLFGIYGRFIGIFTVLHLLLWSFVVFNEINTRRKIINVLKVSVATAVLIAVYGILQYFDLFVNIFYWTQDPLERAFGTIGHSNHTAAYLGINFVILIGLIRISSFGWKKLYYWGSLLLLLVALILTASRGGIFAVSIALLLWAIYGLRKSGFKKDLKKYGKIVVSILLIMFIGGLVFRNQIRNLPIVERSVSTVTYIQEGNMPDRVSWWLSTFEMIGDSPFFGHGLSTYRDIFNQYRRTDFVTPDETQDTITPQSAHNEYLTIGATQGLIGLAIYLLMIVMAFMCARNFMKRAKNWEDQVLTYAIAMGVVVYILQALISFGVVSTLFTFYTLIGLLVSISHSDEKPKEFSVHIVWRSIISVVLFALIIAGCIFSFASLAAEYHYQQAQSNLARRNMEQVFNHYDSAIWYMPYISEYYESYGDFLFKLGLSMPEGTQASYLTDAIDKYTESFHYNDNLPHVFLNYSLVASKLNIEKPNGFGGHPYSGIALSMLQEATKRAKNNPMYLYKYAEMQEYYENYQEAKDLYLKVLEIRNPYKDTEEKLKNLEQYLGPLVEEEGAN